MQVIISSMVQSIHYYIYLQGSYISAKLSIRIISKTQWDIKSILKNSPYNMNPHGFLLFYILLIYTAQSERVSIYVHINDTLLYCCFLNFHLRFVLEMDDADVAEYILESLSTSVEKVDEEELIYQLEHDESFSIEALSREIRAAKLDLPDWL